MLDGIDGRRRESVLESRVQFLRVRGQPPAPGGEIEGAASGGAGVEPSRQREGQYASTCFRTGDPGKRTGTARGDLLPGVHPKLQQLLE